MIRRWVESRVTNLKQKIDRTSSKSYFSSLIRNRWIEFLYLTGIIVMAAGIVNVAINPIDIRYLIYPGRNAQSISETVINSMAISMGFAGMYFAYMSGRQTLKPRLVSFYLVIGILLLAIGFYLGIYVYMSK